MIKKAGTRMETAAADPSPVFISAVMTRLPEATLVFDHFHAVKPMHDTLDEIRRSLYREEKALNKRKVIKDTRRLLLCNGKDIFDSKFKTGLYCTRYRFVHCPSGHSCQ
jgi:transposase